MPKNKSDNLNWFRSSPALGLKQSDVEKIDFETGTIPGVAIVTAGEAKGHGVHLDQEFVEEVVRLGNEKSNGLKGRFGHPAMSSDAVGTFLGRWTDFRVDGEIARADLSIAKSANKTPQGDLKTYTLEMAAHDPDMFGSSIVFKPGATYRRNADGEKIYPRKQNGEWNEDYSNTAGPDYVEIEELHAADVTDEPAANNGLFSAWSTDTFAGRATEFLDQHPEIYEILSKHPDIVEKFLVRYEAHKKKETNMSKTQTTTNTQDSVSTGYVATGPDYKTYIEEFGAEFAADAVNRDLTIDQARTEYIALLRSERDDLRTELQGARDDLAALTEKHDALSATFVSSGTDAVSGGNDDADDGKASEFESRKQKFQPRVGDTVGAMAAGIRLPK